jgi:carboxyl-terminal processing protease
MKLFLLIFFNIEIPKNILYLKVPSFFSYDYYKVKKELKEILKKGEIKGVIVDLRDNPGGFLNLAKDFCEYFIPEGETIAIFNYFNGKKEYLVSENPSPPFSNIPIAILVNKKTASAAELVSLTLSYHKKIKIFGEKTNSSYEIKYYKSGKDFTILITVGYWQVFNFINYNGIRPDFLINDETKQLEEAIKYLKRRINEVH